jgi:hypothetical protein
VYTRTHRTHRSRIVYTRTHRSRIVYYPHRASPHRVYPHSPALIVHASCITRIASCIPALTRTHRSRIVYYPHRASPHRVYPHRASPHRVYPQSSCASPHRVYPHSSCVTVSCIPALIVRHRIVYTRTHRSRIVYTRSHRASHIVPPCKPSWCSIAHSRAYEIILVAFSYICISAS